MALCCVLQEETNIEAITGKMRSRRVFIKELLVLENGFSKNKACFYFPFTEVNLVRSIDAIKI